MKLWYTLRDSSGNLQTSKYLRLYEATGASGSWGWGSLYGNFTSMGDGNYYIEVTDSGNYGVKVSDDGSTWTNIDKTLGMFISTEDITTHIDDTTKHFTEASIDHTNIQNIGTNSHSDIDTHIADDDKHREINDSGTAITDLWSANKIDSELDQKVGVDDDPDINGYDNATLKLTSATAYATETSGSGFKIDVSVPENCKIIACQLRVDVALSVNWDAKYDDGSSFNQSIATNQDKSLNTKVSKFYDVNANSDITSNPVGISITPNLGSFTGGGQMRAVIYYFELTAMDNYGT